jgi:flavin reductase (DIM6/NTAB) family NADH-FMN oxidoreductase RutF
VNAVIETPPAAAAGFDGKAFRRALGTFPTGVAIITTRTPEGQSVGLTCNSFASVSLDPPLVLWSLRTSSKSLPAFRASSAFAINVLAEDQGQLSARFASGAIANKFEGVPHEAGLQQVPLIGGCLARFECSTYSEHEAGDHVIFIGRVERFEGCREDDPLVFYKGAYMMLAQSLRELAAQGRGTGNELLESRAGVYGILVRMACVKGTEEDFSAMEARLAEMDAQADRGDMAARALGALEFYKLVTRAAHNEVLSIVAQTLETLMQHSVTAQAAIMPWPALHRPMLQPVRRRMVACMRAGDTEGAAAAVAEYFELVQQSRPPAAAAAS